MRTINLGLKRVIDIFGSLVGGLLISPLFIIIAIAIKLTSKGPVFFRQHRIGKKGKIFKIMKFRTMVVNAEYIGEGIRISRSSDPRITKVGKILRATSLDELPQLWNVLLGDMSLVGPRPPVVYHPYKGYDGYPEPAKMRFVMRPGITGLAQVTVRSLADWDERIIIDIEYIKKFNIWLDFKILLKTFKKIFDKNGIY